MKISCSLWARHPRDTSSNVTATLLRNLVKLVMLILKVMPLPYTGIRCLASKVMKARSHCIPTERPASGGAPKMIDKELEAMTTL